MTTTHLRIAMIGQKSIPARYGGVETHVQAVSTRLAEHGHDVWVFCRSRFKPSPAEIKELDGYTIDNGEHRWRGVRLVFRSSINTKHLDAATHCLRCAVEAAFGRSFDIVHFHGIGPSAFATIPRLAGRNAVSTLHALDWRQVKWKGFSKALLRRGEATGMRKSSGVIAVSKILVEYIREQYGVEARYIPNGASIGIPRPVNFLKEFGLRGNDYVLTVGRIIPDRGLHYLIDALKRLETRPKLIIVGSEVPPTAYTERLIDMADGNVIFTGDLYGDDLHELYSNCRFYVLASEVEGLPITVCEAMAHGRAVLLSDIPENREVGGDAAIYFKSGDVNSLHEQLKKMLDATDEDLAPQMKAGLERATREYNWDLIADQVEAYYHEVLGR